MLTRLISAATSKGRGRRTVSPVIERASTLLNDSTLQLSDANLGPIYGIEDMSAARELRTMIADMEDGVNTWLVPSGLMAVTVPLMALLKAGDEIVTTDALYGPTRRFLTRFMAERGVKVRFHRADASSREVAAALGRSTRMLLIESPASLTFEMLDVPMLADVCRARGILTVMDNTWAAGLAFQPLSHGVDVSVQALTKYANGHSDLLMGAITTRSVDLDTRIGECIEDIGSRVSSDEAWLALRGMRTLPLRLSAQADAALMIGRWLLDRAEIAEVLYPPLPESRGHEIWRSTYTGAAALVGLVLNGGSEDDAAAFIDALTLFGIGYSWGGFESLVTLETQQLKRRAWPPELAGPLIRLHIGLEASTDLIADLDAALAVWRARQDSNLQPSA
ncbi:MAG: cystathionine beta-lyase [Brevundimonas sp.]|nr:MAG: cystathionine beta-lyase [Brevundimonas sp.]